MKKHLLAGLTGLLAPALVLATDYDLTVDRVRIDTGHFVKEGIGYNGQSPGPVLRFKQGEIARINVTNNLDEATSIHWHGLILPYEQDGVPGISFAGIRPGETFTYEFPVVQAGTYWFHSHSGFQEPDGALGAIIIDPESQEPFDYDRDYVIQLTDKHPHSGDRIMRNLKTMPDYYNRQQQTLGELFTDASSNGWLSTLRDRTAWGHMRMMRGDVDDVQGFAGLINGKSPQQNWTGLFEPGERIRLRFINSSAMTSFDVRIPGLGMTVVQADGNNVQAVDIDEFRIGVAETYDVIVQPEADRAYTIFAESMGRSGFARATLAPEEGMEAPVPPMRKPARLTMADMPAMDHGQPASGSSSEMDHGSHTRSPETHHAGMTGQEPAAREPHHPGSHAAVPAKNHSMPPAMAHSTSGGGSAGHMDHDRMTPGASAAPGMDHAAMAGASHGMVEAHGHRGARESARPKADPFYAPGSGIAPSAADGGKFLSYGDLRAHEPLYDDREPTREIELRLTGNMERYIWSINGVKYEDAEPIRLTYGERVRFRFVNETMMTHPMHLHGMWSILDVGAGALNPIKHTVNVQPGTTVYVETEVDAPGQWAFHCHLSYHASSGMFRKIIVEGGPAEMVTEVTDSTGGGA